MSILAALLWLGCTPEPAAPRHVVLISIDTLRADAVGAYGSRTATPHIDALAAEGVRFTRAWPAATTTLASHTSMLTGLMPHSHGVPSNGALVDPDNTTLAEVLQAQGFTTLGVVGGTPMKGSTGLAQGFDDYTGPERPGSRVSQTAAAAVEAHPGARIFLFAHYWDVHWPYSPPAPWDRMYRTDSLTLTGTFEDVRRVRKLLAEDAPEAEAMSAALKGAYAGAVSYTDAQVGALMDSLKAQGRYDDALIILTADHGESMDEHWEHWSHGKSTYETAVHVPLIIRMPGGAGGGAVVDTPVSLTDLLPTVLDLLDIPLPGPVDGVSLVDGLAGEPFTRAPVVVEATAPSQQRRIDGNHWINQHNCAAILDGSAKLHHCPWRKEKLEQYDLAADPMEQSGLPTTSVVLLEALKAARSETTPRRILTDRDPGMAEALKALGYVESR